MPITTMPAIDVEPCHDWTENDRDLYNSLPYYFAKMQVEVKKTFPTFSRFVKKRPWTRNQGPIMKGVRSVMSPHMRQQFIPTVISSTPKKDVMNVREVTASAQVHRHRFESPMLNFLPSFNDFMDHVDDTGKDIMEKVERANDLFIRTVMLHSVPFVFVATKYGVKLVHSAFWTGTDASTMVATGKSQGVIANLAQQVAAEGNNPLSLLAVNAACSIMENDLGVPFFKGSDLPSEDQPLDGKFCLVCDSEAYRRFTFDPWMLQNKNCNLDVINGPFKGSFFGYTTARIEDKPLRYKMDGSQYDCEIRVEGADQYNEGETLPHLNYTSLTDSPIGVAWLMGAPGYDSISVGPPPSAFTGDSPPHNFPGMKWNGEVFLTKDFLVPCLNEDTGEVTWETNVWGENIKYMCQNVYGMLPRQRRNAIPIFYRRQRGPENPA